MLVSTIPLLLALQLSGERRNNNGNNHNDNTNNQHHRLMSAPLILSAMLGGAALSFGNISFQWATAVYGAPLTTVLAMQASLTVILGTSINYLLEPEMTARPDLLLTGVGVFLVAIGLATRAQNVYLQQQRQRLVDDMMENSSRMTGATGGVMEYADVEFHYAIGSFDNETYYSVEEEQESQRRFRTGTMIALMGGLAFGFFSPAFNVAVNDPFGWNDGQQDNGADNRIDERDSSLLVFYANLWFSLSFGVASVVGNLALLKFELQDQNVEEIIWAYVTQASWMDRRVALLAGIVCAAGNVLQFHGGQLVGYATADLVQAYPLVSTLWDILWFGEFAHVRWCCSALSVLLVGMYVCYVGGIVLLAVSSLD